MDKLDVCEYPFGLDDKENITSDFALTVLVVSITIQLKLSLIYHSWWEMFSILIMALVLKSFMIFCIIDTISVIGIKLKFKSLKKILCIVSVIQGKL